MKDDLISQKGICLANSSYLREWFALNKTPVYLETTVKEIRDDKVICQDKSGKTIDIPCDSVISSVGYVPSPLTNGKESGAEIVGDAEKVGNLRTVIWRAFEAAAAI